MSEQENKSADTQDQHPDDFFVGYLPQRSARQSGFLWGSAIGLVCAAAVLGLGFTATQPPADVGAFQYGTVREVTATVRVLGGTPLLLDLAASDGAPLPFTQGDALAVRTGKFGAQHLLDQDGQRVRLRGTLIYRPGTAMVELDGMALPTDDQDGAPAELDRDDAEPAGLAPATPVELTGEIVDAKCFLGVMKPGRGAVHRACAVRCLSGGVPAALRVVKPDGSQRVLVMVAGDDQPLGVELLDLVGVPVTVSGEVLRQGDLEVLRTSRAQVRRVAAPLSRRGAEAP